MQLFSSDFSTCYDTDHPTCMSNAYSYYEVIKIMHNYLTSTNVMPLISGEKSADTKVKGRKHC